MANAEDIEKEQGQYEKGSDSSAEADDPIKDDPNNKFFKCLLLVMYAIITEIFTHMNISY